MDNSCFVTLSKEEMKFSYRHSVCKENGFIVISATFLLACGDEAEIKNAMKASIEKRKATQPLEFPNAGSIFKRPENSYAGKLIEDAGLKGFCVGGASVSEKHAGFIINTGKATSKDIYELIDIIKAKVYSLSGVMLECEVEKL
jgi:UDP-N-acetylmuramate dehydrogenase